MMKTKFDPKTGKITIFRGKKVQDITRRGYAGAAIRPGMEDWHTSNASADSKMESGIYRLRSRSRFLEDDNPYFKRWLSELEANVLGDEGIVLAMDCRSAAHSKMIEEAWRMFSKSHYFSANRLHSRLEFSRLTLRGIARDGDSGILFARSTGKSPFGLMLQGFESDYVDENFNDENRRIRMGVERDPWGEPDAYHLFSKHPGDNGYFYGHAPNVPKVRIPAQKMDSLPAGNTFLLGMQRSRFGQTRGVPWGKAAIKQARQIEKFEEAAVLKKRIAAAHMGFFSHPDDDPEGMPKNAHGQIEVDLEPGNFQDIGRRTFTAFSPQDVNDYSEFRKGMLRGIATGLGVSYHVLANDLEGVSFSSIRQGVLSERELWKLLQKWYISEIEGPVFVAWLEAALFNNAIPIPFSQFEHVCRPVFQGRRWDWVDPLKDVNAAVIAINNDLSSKMRENMKRGQDPRRIADEREIDEELYGGAGDSAEGGDRDDGDENPEDSRHLRALA